MIAKFLVLKHIDLNVLENVCYNTCIIFIH